MSENLLQNADFEMEWNPDDEYAHKVFVLPDREWREIGNVFAPPKWRFWFVHEPGVWDQPEARDARAADPDRMYKGMKGFCWFTFGRKHDAGLFQQINVTPGSKVWFGVYAHAWSNHKDDDRPDDFPHPDDPRWSEGAGYESVAWPAGSQPQTGDPQQDAKSNFTFWVGIDPTGGIDALADTVVWGPGRHIYNGFAMLYVEAIAQSSTITVFVRSQTLWQFKHNDAYIDAARLIVEEPEPMPEGDYPRIDYTRSYFCLQQSATLNDIKAVAEIAYANRRTIGFSADDALMGPGLTDKAGIFIGWPETQYADLIEFRDLYYPGAKIEFMSLPSHDPVPITPLPVSTARKTTLHLQDSVAGWEDFVRDAKPAWMLVFQAEKARIIKELSPGTKVAWRNHFYNYYEYQDDPDPAAAAKRFLDHFWDSVVANDEHLDGILGLNETTETGCWDKNRAAVRFSVALIKELASRQSQLSSPVHLVALNTAIGNIGHDREEIKLLIPLVEALLEHGGWLGYHPYLPCHPDPGVSERWLEEEGVHWHLRALQSWDPVFRSYGLQPKYLFTEGGPCGATMRDDGRPGGMDSGAGWRATNCLNGDWPRTLALITRYEEILAGYPQAEAVTLFTSNPWDNDTWKYFQIKQPEMISMAQALG